MGITKRVVSRGLIIRSGLLFFLGKFVELEKAHKLSLIILIILSIFLKSRSIILIILIVLILIPTAPTDQIKSRLLSKTFPLRSRILRRYQDA